MPRNILAFAAIMTACTATTAVSAQTVVSVPGTGDVYMAGRPAGYSCCNGDTAPADSPVLAPISLSSGEYLTFTTTGGAAHAQGDAISPTADGNTSFTYDLTADYGTGISGPKSTYLNGLAGVFLGPDVPTGPAPSQLGGTSYSTLSPGLNQIFFIGDGLTGTGSGTLQTFYVPNGATRLFLGIMDDGGYYDNRGTITATITPHLADVGGVPEPSTWTLMMLGVGMVGAGLRSRGKNPVRGAKTAELAETEVCSG